MSNLVCKICWPCESFIPYCTGVYSTLSNIHVGQLVLCGVQSPAAEGFHTHCNENPIYVL